MKQNVLIRKSFADAINYQFTVTCLQQEQSFRDIPAGLKMGANESKTVDLTKGFGNEELMLVAPFNYQVGQRRTTTGRGLQTLKPSF